jgi:hypothetical protein
MPRRKALHPVDGLADRLGDQIRGDVRLQRVSPCEAEVLGDMPTLLETARQNWEYAGTRVRMLAILFGREEVFRMHGGNWPVIFWRNRPYMIARKPVAS